MQGKEEGGGRGGESRKDIVTKRKAWKKRVWGAPAFQVTPDLGPLWKPSTGLSGGFVRASRLNGHPADRHVVCPQRGFWSREMLLSISMSSFAFTISLAALLKM